MFGLTSVKLYIYLAIILVITGLAFTTKMFHSKWVDAEARVQLKQKEVDDAIAAAKACSDRTEDLRKQTDEKTEVVRQAQAQAAIVAKGNQALANKILQMQATSPDKCIAAAEVLKQYKAQTRK